jgi:hypothetical protein
MILIPSMTKTALSDLAHLAYIVNPTFLDDVDFLSAPFYVKNTRIVSSIYNPPVPVLACALASEWTLNASITYGDATVTATNQTLTYSPTTNIGDKSLSDLTQAVEYAASDTTATSSLIVEVSLGQLPPAYGWTLGEWSLPAGVRINASNLVSPFEESVYYGGNRQASATFGTSFSGVTVTIAGQSVALYDVGGQSAAPSGTITLTPTAWLSLT